MNIPEFRNNLLIALNEKYTVWCMDEKWSVCGIANPIVIQINATIIVNDVPIKIEFTFGKATVYDSNNNLIIVNTVDQFIIAVLTICEKRSIAI
jgi:hypothetical protein